MIQTGPLCQDGLPAAGPGERPERPLPGRQRGARPPAPRCTRRALAPGLPAPSPGRRRGRRGASAGPPPGQRRRPPRTPSPRAPPSPGSLPSRPPAPAARQAAASRNTRPRPSISRPSHRERQGMANTVICRYRPGSSAQGTATSRRVGTPRRAARRRRSSSSRPIPTSSTVGVAPLGPQAGHRPQHPALPLAGDEAADAPHHEALRRLAGDEDRLHPGPQIAHRAPGEALHPAPGVAAHPENGVGPAQGAAQRLAQPGDGRGEEDLGAVAHHGVGNPGGPPQAGAEQGQGMRCPEQDHVGPEIGHLGLHPAADGAGRPHEGARVAHHPGVAALLGGGQHPHLAREGGHHIAQVLLDASGLGGVVVGDEEHPHGEDQTTPAL